MPNVSSNQQHQSKHWRESSDESHAENTTNCIQCSTVKGQRTYLLEVCNNACSCSVLEDIRTVFAQPCTLYCTVLVWLRWSTSSNECLPVWSTLRTHRPATNPRKCRQQNKTISRRQASQKMPLPRNICKPYIQTDGQVKNIILPAAHSI